MNGVIKSLKAQISFDYLLTLSVVSLLFMAALGVILTQSDLLTVSLKRASEELLCERVSWALTKTYESGGEICIISDYPLYFESNRLIIDDDYLCMLPFKVENCSFAPGELCIKNGRLFG
ncbi:MAG: hypothetical protein ACTSVF_05885 [Candidatus Asgardarchaeia archaeon]